MLVTTKYVVRMRFKILVSKLNPPDTVAQNLEQFSDSYATVFHLLKDPYMSHKYERRINMKPMTYARRYNR